MTDYYNDCVVVDEKGNPIITVKQLIKNMETIPKGYHLKCVGIRDILEKD